MDEVACIDVPWGKMSSETTRCARLTQSMSGQVLENKPSELLPHIESDKLCTEPSQKTHNGDSNMLPVSSSLVSGQLEPVAESKAREDLVIHSSDVIRSCQTEKSSINDSGSGFPRGPEPKQENQLCHGILYNVPIRISTEASDSISTEYLKSSLENVKGVHIITQLESEDVSKCSSLGHFETPSKSLVNKSCQIGRRNKRPSNSRNKKYMLRSSAGNDRVLRSKVQEKPKPLESSNSLGTVGNGMAKKKKVQKRGVKRVIADEFSRTRKRLRYFLNRIHYEQNLIDAYSSEGWKGNSLEKLKPEKELQRATSEILRRKLKIRDLFQHLDSVCAEGRFPKSLFDSEGQIDSEDIFCAKCGSKDSSVGNDIILCDGACDRGFHQFCLEPPLLSEEIPTDDDGWLCPGCDCKVDCIDLLNDSQGTNLLITDSWETVFPEAAAATREGNDQDPNLQLPSDDSDDDDYDPDRPGTVEKVDGSESSSDDSEYASGSDELEAPQKDEQNLGLSSDDSEDDDYDPNAPDDVQIESPSRKAKHELNPVLFSDDSEDNEYDPNAPDVDESKEESSSSDFSSDSEDLDAVIDNEFSENHEVNMSSSSSKRNYKRSRNKSLLKDELLGTLDLGPGEDGSPPISGKRQVERLDYKRLHDETYGNLPSDSSDDEDWNDSTAPRKRRKTTKEVSSVTPNGNGDAINYGHEDNEHTPGTIRRNSAVNDAHNSPSKSLEDSPKCGSTNSRAKSSSNKRLGEAVHQRLHKSFKENQYPDRATKEALAQELGIRPQQVSKWFENTRWSWRHSSGNQTGASGSASKDSAPSPLANKKLVEQEEGTQIRNSTSNGTQNMGNPSASVAVLERSNGDASDGKAKGVVEESSGQKTTTPKPIKRKYNARSKKQENAVVVDKPQTTSGRKRGRR